MHAAARTFDHGYRPRLSKAGFGMVAAIHVALLAALVQLDVIPLPTPLAVLSVSLLPPAPEAKPQPEIVPPRPRPIERRPAPLPLPAPTSLAAPADSPSPSPVAVAPAPTPVVPPAPVAAPPAPAAPTPPRFDADYLDNPRPAYPAISRRLGEQGRVMLRVHVDADGRPTEVQLHTPSGSPRLDQVALDTVRRWKFVAARLGQQPVAAWVLVPIAFTLKD